MQVRRESLGLVRRSRPLFCGLAARKFLGGTKQGTSSKGPDKKDPRLWWELAELEND